MTARTQSHTEMERLIETMRGIVGALNAHGLGLGDGAGESLPVRLTDVVAGVGGGGRT